MNKIIRSFSRWPFSHDVILSALQIYVINLARRVERRKRMMEALDTLGIEAQFVNAVDGRCVR